MLLYVELSKLLWNNTVRRKQIQRLTLLYSLSLHLYWKELAIMFWFSVNDVKSRTHIFMKKILSYVFFATVVLNGIYVLFAIMTYSIAFYKVRKSAMNLRATGTIHGEMVKKLLLVPGIIIGSYIAFYIIPLLVYILRRRWGTCRWQTNFCSFSIDCWSIDVHLLCKAVSRCILNEDAMLF